MRCYKAQCGLINALTPYAFAKNGYSLRHRSVEIGVIYPLPGLLTSWGSQLLLAFREEQTCVTNTLTAVFRSDNCSWFWSTHAFTLPWVALVQYQGLKETTPLEPHPDWQSRYLICCGYRNDNQKGSWEQSVQILWPLQRLFEKYQEMGQGRTVKVIAELFSRWILII